MTGARASYRLRPPKHRYKFRAGEKARCVGTSSWLRADDLTPSAEPRQPRAGETYVVHAVRPFADARQMLALKGMDGWWLGCAFRPAVEGKAKTDISALEAMLRPAGRQKEASNA